MSCLSVLPAAWKNSAPTGRILMKFCISASPPPRNSVDRIQVSLHSDKNNRYFTRRRVYIHDNISLNSSYNEKQFRQSGRENRNTHFMFNNVFFPPKVVPFTKKCGKNVVERDRSQMTIRRMHFTCWTTTVTRNHTHPHCFARQLWFRERASALRYTHIACLVYCTS
jgi:hypothetical protein